MRSLVPAIWTMLESALPLSNSLQEVWIRFRPSIHLWALKDQLSLFGIFGKSPNRLRLDKRWHVFPNLKEIKLIFIADNLRDSDLLLKRLHWVGFGTLEEQGALLKLVIINTEKLESYDEFVLDTISG